MPDQPGCLQVNDTVIIDIETGKVTDFIKFDIGQLIMVTGGRNCGRVGTIIKKEKHKGSFDIVLVRDGAGHEFATRLTNVFIIGKSDKAMISLPKGKGIKLSILQEQARMYGKTTA